ncbi:M48 family metalloprotease [Nonlabens xiamenensis]|uniref:M48 family metalloprotease n=1 Tax=Nonlabens xiamenensis TaxID=2341043 RepID=UPI0013DDCE8F|nr:M48 family metalloprotease [Nonlabens xiamenensis]
MKFQIIIALSILLGSLLTNAQEFSFKPADSDALEDRVELLNHTFKDNITGPNARQVKKYYADFEESFASKIQKGHFWFDSEVQQKLDRILSKVYEVIPELNSDDHLWLIEHSLVPNAACYGNGIFTVNAGLFLTMEHDEEIAFVVCHELAHYLEQHSIKRFQNMAALLKSKEMKDKISSAKRKRFGSTRAGLELMDEISIDILSHSVEAEYEADMVGLDLYKKLGYPLEFAATALDKLRNYGEATRSDQIDLKRVFQTEAYPFKSFWTKKNLTLFSANADVDDFAMKSDSLQTHPDIENRVKKMMSFTQNDSVRNSTMKTKNPLLITLLDMNLEAGNIDYGLFQTIQHYQNQQLTEQEFRHQILKLLVKTAELKKNHSFGKKVSTYLSSSEQKAINEIRNFLHNLSARNLDKLITAYQGQYNLN